MLIYNILFLSSIITFIYTVSLFYKLEKEIQKVKGKKSSKTKLLQKEPFSLPVLRREGEGRGARKEAFSFPTGERERREMVSIRSLSMTYIFINH